MQLASEQCMTTMTKFASTATIDRDARTVELSVWGLESTADRRINSVFVVGNEKSAGPKINVCILKTRTYLVSFYRPIGFVIVTVFTYSEFYMRAYTVFLRQYNKESYVHFNNKLMWPFKCMI